MKIVTLVLGIGTIVIVSSLMVLGIRAFYPEPARPDYSAISKPAPFYGEFNCDKSDANCIVKRDANYEAQRKQNEELAVQQRAYDDAMKIYDRNLFVIANILGMMVFVAGFLILFKTAIASQGVPIGIMVAGFYGILYGYVRGWESIGDRLKFFVGLLVAALVLGGSIRLVDRYQKRKADIRDGN